MCSKETGERGPGWACPYDQKIGLYDFFIRHVRKSESDSLVIVLCGCGRQMVSCELAVEIRAKGFRGDVSGPNSRTHPKEKPSDSAVTKLGAITPCSMEV
jgi:hypothetical protein